MAEQGPAGHEPADVVLHGHLLQHHQAPELTQLLVYSLHSVAPMQPLEIATPKLACTRGLREDEGILQACDCHACVFVGGWRRGDGLACLFWIAPPGNGCIQAPAEDVRYQVRSGQIADWLVFDVHHNVNSAPSQMPSAGCHCCTAN